MAKYLKQFSFCWTCFKNHTPNNEIAILIFLIIKYKVFNFTYLELEKTEKYLNCSVDINKNITKMIAFVRSSWNSLYTKEIKIIFKVKENGGLFIYLFSFVRLFWNTILYFIQPKPKIWQKKIINTYLPVVMDYKKN